MSSPGDDEEARALRARKNLKRIARAVEYEAYEAAELRREEERQKLAAHQAKPTTRPSTPEQATGRRKGMASQRGK